MKYFEANIAYLTACTGKEASPKNPEVNQVRIGPRPQPDVRFAQGRSNCVARRATSINGTTIAL